MIKLYATDCEGPIVLNDNAFEICQHFLPNGDKFFKQISLYDDYLAEIEKKDDYQAGTTLALILPFLKAYGVTEEDIKDYSTNHLELVSKVKETIQKIPNIVPVYIISTSYNPFIEAVCEELEFPKQRAFSSQIFLDKYELSQEESDFLKNTFDSLVELPLMDIEGCRTPEELNESTQETVLKLNKIFWEQLPEYNCNKIIESAKIIGANEKTKTVKKLCEDLEIELSDTVYVGDSITDVPTFRTVKDGGGITISFNGNSWAVNAAEYSLISEDAIPLYNMLMILNNEKNKIFRRGQDDISVFIEKSEKMREYLRGKAGELG